MKSREPPDLVEDADLTDLYPSPENEVEEKLFGKVFKFRFTDGNKRRNTWRIDTPLEIRYILNAIKNDVSYQDLAIQIGCPREVAKKAKIKIQSRELSILRKLHPRPKYMKRERRYKTKNVRTKQQKL